MRFWLTAGLEVWCPEMSNLSVSFIAHLTVVHQRLAILTGISDMWILDSCSSCTENLVSTFLGADSKDDNRNNLQSTTFTTSWAEVTPMLCICHLASDQARSPCPSHSNRFLLEAAAGCRQELSSLCVSLPPSVGLSSSAYLWAVLTFRSFLSSWHWPLRMTGLRNASIPKM